MSSRQDVERLAQLNSEQVSTRDHVGVTRWVVFGSLLRKL